MPMSHTAARLTLGLAGLVFIAGCGSGDSGYLDRPAAQIIMAIPVSTSSDAAKTHFLQGMDALDMARGIDAREHFAQAVAADPAFALGYLELAGVGSSLQQFTSNLQKAEEHAASASRPEQLMIEITRKGSNNDVEGQLRAAEELAQVATESPRAWMILAGVQSTLNRHGEARASLAKAIELAPSLAAAHIQLGNSYLFNEPRDLAQAEAHMRHAVELRPEEPNPYDFLGDVQRAQGKLADARQSYTMAAERSPNDGSPIQQRAHVNSFLGDYAAARADYDKAIAMGRANQAPNYAMYRAFVHLHEGNPPGAVDELKQLIARVDGMNVPEPTGVKINLTANAAWIALRQGNTAEAAPLVASLTDLMRQQIATVGTDEFRRGQESGIAYFDALLALSRKDYAAATRKANEIASLVEPMANPRKMEPVHELQGMVSLARGRHAEAAAHLRQANQSDIYVRYLLAEALAGAGQTAEARQIYTEVANHNFNSAAFAMIRKDAIAKSTG